MDHYRHGTYGELVSVSTAPTTSPSCVVYVGTAPAHKIKGQTGRSDLFNAPLRIASLRDARKLLGYSEQAPFEKYTLCEAVEVHFKNSIQNIGPIYCINVLDPEESAVEMEEGMELGVTKKQAAFTLGDLILDSIQVESADKVDEPPTKEEEPEEEKGPDEPEVQSEESLEDSSSALVEGIDYKLAYDSTTDTVTLTFLGEEIPTKILIKGKIVDPTIIGAKEIIGEITEEGKKTGLQAIKDMYRLHDEITNIICAPGFSEIPEVYQAMLKVAVKLSGHWDAFVNADIPLKDGTTLINTIEKAIQWKKDHDYTNGRSEVHWIKGIRGNAKLPHLSTLNTATMQALDTAAGGVPYQSSSNKEIDIIGVYGGEDFAGFDQYEANELNAHGITTGVRLGGKWRLWGGHTAAYNYEAEAEKAVNPDANFDRTTQFTTGIRTLMHITNRFQADNLDLIDQPMTSAIKDTIIQKEQSKLDTLVSIGALLGQPKIYFSEDNDAPEVMGGNFVWDISATTGVPFKSATVRLGYTDEGIYTLLGEEE